MSPQDAQKGQTKAFFTIFWPHLDEQKLELLKASAILREGDL